MSESNVSNIGREADHVHTDECCEHTHAHHTEPQREMTSREKLRMKLRAKKMMRTSKTTLKNMYEREQK